MTARQRIVLYNPQAVFFTMPLALIAVGSHLDPRRYDVRIVDGRLERDPVSAVLDAADGALALGVSVLTGAPIRDALQVSRAVKGRRPDLPVIWGGWHPSLFPAETAAEASVDAVVTGQGEAAFAELVDRLAAGEPPGPRVSPARPLADVNAFAPHNYDLVDVERYFACKGARQLDYVSSQGCRFRCTFCADPSVYGRGWSGLEPARVGSELERLRRRFGVTDVAFQDETFFTSGTRVAAIAGELLRRGIGVTWTATMRADQGVRLDEAVFGVCRRAGLRRVMIGVESGSPALLRWMKKDITLEQVFGCADRCRRHGIAALFNLIVGFPGEPRESVTQTLDVAKRLRAMSPDFEIAIFYYKPYPGSEMAEALARCGHGCPAGLEAWADFDYVERPSPWLDRSTRRLVERFKFYQRVGWSRPAPLRAPIQALARWRCAHDRYAFPVEKLVAERLRPAVRLA